MSRIPNRVARFTDTILTPILKWSKEPISRLPIAVVMIWIVGASVVMFSRMGLPTYLAA
jgi:hypothetical protein